MKIKRYLFPALLVATGLAIILQGVIKPALAKSAADYTAYDDIDAYIEEQMQRLRIPGLSLAIVEGDQIVHLRGFGQARPNGEMPSPQTPFLIGSLTKSFTALAVMQLVEAGKIELDTPVQHYLPWFQVSDPQASAQITVRHLLNQTSGLSTSSGWIPLADFDNSPEATERQARELSTLELTHPVGSGFEYSNSNYNLLGLIIEAVSGEWYADYIQNHIFTPLDMSRSYTSQTIAKKNGLAVGHQYWFWVPSAVPDLPIPQGSLPSGQLISSSEDMARYMIALLNEGYYGGEEIISGTGITELHRGVAENIEMGISKGKYAMGWYVSEIGQTKLAWHSGSVPDYSSYMALLPEQRKGIVLLVNADHFMMVPALSEVGAGVTALLAGNQPTPIKLGFIPWMMRSLMLIPLIQIFGVAATLRLIRRWQQDPLSHPSVGRKWGLHVLLPLVLNLLVALTLIPMLGPMRGFWKLFMPDFSWIALVSGSFAGIWAFLRTGLILHTLGRQSRVRKISQQKQP
jgi:CubicO group peptidase (beta-lactamase class C family)